MTDLTEKWKKGELPDGYYWIRLSWGGMIIMAYYTGFDGIFELDDHYYDSDEISEVLAEVPDYNLWQNLWNTADMEHKANNKLIEDVERLEKENKELKKQVNHLSKTQARQFVDNQKLQVKAEKAKDVVNFDMARQIIQLKELLEECRPFFNALVEKRLKLEYIPQVYELLTKINELLK